MKTPPTTVRAYLQGKSRSGKNDSIEVSRFSLQEIEKGKTYTFSYARRSTTKKEQAESLLQQEEGINFIANKLGIDTREIYQYSESKSGFENRTREEWKRMMNDMDRVWEGGGKCELICRDSSRLSRNPYDNIQITDRLFGDNHFKKQRAIEKIYMLGDGLDIIEWTHQTVKKNIVDELHSNYTNSLGTKAKSINGILLKLQSGEFPYAPPHGLERITLNGVIYKMGLHKGESTILRQAPIMKYIRRVFEMKVEGKTAKEISAYLKKYAGIYIAPKKIVETIIQNTVYKGEYTEKTTGLFFNTLKFHEGKPPIEKSLWEKANATVGKRGSGIGKAQAEHLFRGKIKTEAGLSFQFYIAKGKSGTGRHFNYKAIYKNARGENKNIYISETDILKYLVQEIYQITIGIFEAIGISEIEQKYKWMIDSKCTYLGYDAYTQADYEQWVRKDIEDYYKKLDSVANDFPKILSELFSLTEGNIDSVLDGIFQESEASIQKIGIYRHQFMDEMKEQLIERLSIREELLRDYIKESPFFRQLQDELVFRENNLKRLEQDKQKIEKELEEVQDKAFDMGYDKAFADKQAMKVRQKLLDIEESIRTSSETTNLQSVLEELPSLLAKIVELSSNTICKEELRGIRDDIQLILDLIAVELIITNKKELKLELFLCLGGIVNEGNGNWSHLWDTNP